MRLGAQRYRVAVSDGGLDHLKRLKLGEVYLLEEGSTAVKILEVKINVAELASSP
jgi:hypothetical protein